jgi:hypothetical protein
VGKAADRDCRRRHGGPGATNPWSSIQAMSKDRALSVSRSFGSDPLDVIDDVHRPNLRHRRHVHTVTAAVFFALANLNDFGRQVLALQQLVPGVAFAVLISTAIILGISIGRSTVRLN